MEKNKIEENPIIPSALSQVANSASGNAATYLGIVALASYAILTIYNLSSWPNSKDIVKNIKKWWWHFRNDKSIKAIVDRLKNDEEVMKYVKNNKLRGIRDVVAKKLSKDEIKYLNHITRSKFDS